MAVYYFTISVLTGLGYIFTEKNIHFHNSNHTGVQHQKKAAAFYLAAAFLLLTFLASFRYAIGFDYFSYRDIYAFVSGWSFQDIFLIYPEEPLYYAVCKLFSLAGCPWLLFLLIINIFLMAVSMQFIYRFSRIPWVSVYLYITLQFLAYNMNLIRQSIATAFFMLAYPYLKNRKLLPFTIFILLGGLFHNSLLFLYPLYFLLPLKFSRKALGLLTGATLLLYLFFDPLFQFLAPILPVKYAAYQGGYFWNSNGFDYIIPSGIYCLLIYLFRNRLEDSPQGRIFQNSALYQFLITLFITKHFILERFAVYPFIFSLIAVPELIYSFREKPKKTESSGKFTLTYRGVLLLFLLFGLGYFLFAANRGFHRVYPYVSLLDKSSSSPVAAP
ncbi:EpsG family protein [Lachnospiraceae bacterium KK002]